MARIGPVFIESYRAPLEHTQGSSGYGLSQWKTTLQCHSLSGRIHKMIPWWSDNRTGPWFLIKCEIIILDSTDTPDPTTGAKGDLTVIIAACVPSLIVLLLLGIVIVKYCRGGSRAHSLFFCIRSHENGLSQREKMLHNVISLTGGDRSHVMSNNR